MSNLGQKNLTMKLLTKMISKILWKKDLNNYLKN